MMSESESIGVRSLLEKTYFRVSDKLSFKEVTFEGTDPFYSTHPMHEIACDPDYNGDRLAYMSYNKIDLLKHNNKTWALGLGKPTGKFYLASEFSGDIINLEMNLENKSEEEIKEELINRIGGGKYFENSLIIGLSDGRIGFGKKMEKHLPNDVGRFIARKPTYSSDLINPTTMMPVNTGQMKYKPEFTEFLAKTIENILE